ncbi:MAG: hypothetical protein ACPIOQ_67500, partial [Promethearchaeia archaeon]
MTPSTPGAASKDDHKKQRRRERAGRESRLVSYGLSALAAVLAAVVSFSSWVLGERICPMRVQFSQARLGPLAGYR